MKKFILSVFVIASFGTYVVLQSNGNSSRNLLPLTASNSLNNTNQNTNSVAVVSNNNTPSSNTSSGSSSGSSGQNSNPSSPAIIPPKQTGMYKDGQYTGISADAYYGNVQVKAIISGGKLVDIQFLDYPQDRSTSVSINSRALPILRQEAIAIQSANVNAVSGASASSPAFIRSLASALSQAKA